MRDSKLLTSCERKIHWKHYAHDFKLYYKAVIIITVWECQLKKNNVEQSMHEVEHWINRSLLIKSGDRFSMHIDHRYYPSSEETNYDIAAEPEHNGYKE